MHTTNYESTFIEVAEDCPAQTGIEPPVRMSGTSLARMQYEKLSEHPYVYTSDELLLALYMSRHRVPADGVDEARRALFSKGQPCMRASDLAKKYGWGVHFDGQGRMALCAVDACEYARLRADPVLTHKRAMRNGGRSTMANSETFKEE